MPDEAVPDEAMPDGEGEEPGRVKNMVVRYGIGVCQVCGNAARVENRRRRPVPGMRDQGHGRRRSRRGTRE